MIIATGQSETHETPLPLDSSHSPGVAAPTQRFPDGHEPGGVVTDIAGLDFTGEAAAAMSAGMAADGGRRGGYEQDIKPLGSEYGYTMDLPPVVSDWSKHTGGSDATAYDPAG